MRLVQPVLLVAALVGLTAPVHGDDWPQWGGPHHDGVWREKGIAETLPQGQLPRMWSTPTGEGYAGPAVAEGRVYITDLIERKARDAIERIRSLDAATGQVKWEQKYPVSYSIDYPAGPRATPVIDGPRVYTIGAMGDLLCCDAANGEVLWKKSFQTDFDTVLPIWGMAASPYVDGDQLITLVGGAKGALVVSFDKSTGNERWRALSDKEIGYCPPTIFTFGKSRQLIVWHPRSVTALDPATGKQLWDIPWAIKAGLCVPTPRQFENRLLFTSFYNGSLMLEVSADPPAAKILWKGKSNSEQASRTDGLHSIMSTPIFDGKNIYGVCSYGQVRGLDASNGKRLWETLEATGDGRWWNAFFVPQGDRTFIHNEQGDLIIAKLAPDGYHELSRAKLIEPTRLVMNRMTIWSHPAFAMKSVFARNDEEIIRVDLSAK